MTTADLPPELMGPGRYATTTHLRPALLPMSISQKHLWNSNRMAPERREHNQLIVIGKVGALDHAALRRALTEVVARHEAWRTTFRDIEGEPHQFVHEPETVDLPLTDLSHLGREEARRRAADIAVADTVRPFDLARGPLVRPRLIRFSKHSHRLHIGIHQMIFDWTSLRRVVFPELVALYHSFADGLPVSSRSLPPQYAHYTRWELDWVDRPETKARIERWRGRLHGITPLQLPQDHPRPVGQRFASGVVPLTIDRVTVQRLRSAARKSGGTLSDAFAAAYAWWLHLYTGSEDIVFGTAHDLRQHNDVGLVVGYCVTPLVLRCGVYTDDSFGSLLGRVHNTVVKAVSDVVPFATLLTALDIPRDPRSHPVFQAELNFQPFHRQRRAHAEGWSLDGTEFAVQDAVGSSSIDISIELDERPDGHVAGRLVFNTDLFDHATAREMASTWYEVLRTATAAPHLQLIAHELVSAEQRQRQLGWNPIAAADEPSLCVHDVISAQVERTPDAVAVQDAKVSLTYRQLDERAAAIAARLMQEGAGPGTVVAVLTQRTTDQVAAILGVLKSGSAFLPLDPRQPAARSMFSVNDAGAQIILTDRELTDNGESGPAMVIDLRDESFTTVAAHENSSVTASDLAYVIYTSGSTGRPKGVLIEHRGVTNLMNTMYRKFGVGASDTVLAVSSISFDVALGDIFCALSCGARLVLASAEQATDPSTLGRLIDDSGATYMMATPTTWNALVAAGWRGNPRLTAASIGETLSDSLAEGLLQRCRSVWNTYGPTEATVITSVVQLHDGDTVTVGTPLTNVRQYVVDPHGRLQPVGVPGEIAIAGVAVARGYQNRPDEHARRFCDDPFNTGDRMYRTGDRGRLLPNGRLQHLGRYDEQVKIRGFRIEPGEIEAMLCENPHVSACAVVAREACSGEKQLVAYVVGDSMLSDAQVREWLRQRLPEYMVPSALVHLDTLPTTSSGKLNRMALPYPSPQPATSMVGEPPRTDTEIRVAALWENLLHCPVTDVKVDFFDTGGHSLLAARLLAAIEQAFGLSLPLSAFLESGRTIAGIAAALDARGDSAEDVGKDQAPLHFIFSDIPSAMSMRHFTAQWGATQPVHTLLPDRPVGGAFDQSLTIELRAASALSQMRERQPSGPLSIVGYSFGGILAYEAARQAVEAGEQVDWLCILDANAPPVARWERAQTKSIARLRRLRASPAREQWSKCVEVAQRVLRHGRQGLWIANDFDYGGAIEMTCDYSRPGHRIPLDLIVADATAAAVPASNLGWDEYHDGVLRVHRLSHGDHTTMLEQPQVDEVATIMSNSLRRAAAPSSDT